MDGKGTSAKANFSAEKAERRFLPQTYITPFLHSALASNKWVINKKVTLCGMTLSEIW
jgi:hypothetical protein